MENSSIFVLWPYLAFGLCAGGIFVRYLLALRHPDTLRADLVEAKSTFEGQTWWISMFILLAGHLGGLLWPRVILWWNANPVRLYVLEGVAGIAGFAAFLSGASLVLRFLRRPTRSLLTELFDTLLLAALFTSIVSGVLVAIIHRWGSSWGVTILTPYIMSLLRGGPAPDLVLQMPFLVRLHIVSAFVALALVPLTRIAIFAVAALQNCVVVVGYPARAAGNAVSAWLARHNPTAWFWPEED